MRDRANDCHAVIKRGCHAVLPFARILLANPAGVADYGFPRFSIQRCCCCRWRRLIRLLCNAWPCVILATDAKINSPWKVGTSRRDGTSRPPPRAFFPRGIRFDTIAASFTFFHGMMCLLQLEQVDQVLNVRFSKMELYDEEHNWTHNDEKLSILETRAIVVIHLIVLSLYFYSRTL